MFTLTETDLRGRAVSDCPGGASSFTAEASERGAHVVAVDPAYSLPTKTLRQRPHSPGRKAPMSAGTSRRGSVLRHGGLTCDDASARTRIHREPRRCLSKEARAGPPQGLHSEPRNPLEDRPADNRPRASHAVFSRECGPVFWERSMSYLP
jgi:hypothetical protein